MDGTLKLKIKIYECGECDWACAFHGRAKAKFSTEMFGKGEVKPCEAQQRSGIARHSPA